MAVKVYDTLKSATGKFPVVEASEVNIEITNEDGAKTTKTLQKAIEDGDISIGAIDNYTKDETDVLLEKKLDIEHDVLDEGKATIVGSDGNIELRKLNGSDVSITVDGNLKTIQDSLNVANGIPVLDTNGKILTTQLPTSARKIVGYIDAENVHTLPDASLYDAGSELVVTSNGTINQSTAFTLTSGKQLTEMEVANANLLIANGYVFTLSADSELGTVHTFDSDKVTLDDGTEIALPYASDLSATSTPAVVLIDVAIGDGLMMIDGHWVHLSNTSNVSSVNSKGGNVVLTGSDINVTIDGEQRSIQSAIENGDIGVGDAEDVAYANTEHTAWTNVKKALDGIINKVYYVKPSITSFSMTPSTTTYEIGSKVDSLVFNWTTNKDIQTQTLTGCTLADETVRTATYATTVSSNKTFTLSVNDGENSASASKTISFLNKIHWGSCVEPATYDSTFILGLTNEKLTSSNKGDFSFNAGSGEYCYFATPAGMKITSAWVNGFQADLQEVITVSHTNASGNTSNYTISRFSNTGLGSFVATVK